MNQHLWIDIENIKILNNGNYSKPESKIFKSLIALLCDAILQSWTRWPIKRRSAQIIRQNISQNFQKMNSVHGIQLTSLVPFHRKEIAQPPMGRRGHWIISKIRTNYKARRARLSNRCDLSWKKFLRPPVGVSSGAAHRTQAWQSRAEDRRQRRPRKKSVEAVLSSRQETPWGHFTVVAS